MSRRRRTLATACMLLGLACGTQDQAPEAFGSHDFRFPKESLIAHALGGIDGRAYTNSAEALEDSLARGSRFLEVDLSFTADGDLVCFHTKHEKYLGTETPVAELTTAEFLEHRYTDRFTLITLETLLQRLKSHPDVYLVTDCKAAFKPCMEAVMATAGSVDPALAGRIIPQFYTVDQWRDVASLETVYGPFATVIFTLYRTKINDDAVVEIAANRAVPVITMSRKRFNPDLVKRLEAIGVDSLVHTVNKPAEIIGYVNQGVRGLYTDRYREWPEVVAALHPPTSPPREPSAGVAGDPPPG